MTEPAQILPAFIDDPKAPEVFASFVSGVAFDGPNIRITFSSSRVNHVTTPGPVNNVVNLRLVMSIQSVQNMVGFLNEFLKTAELNATQKPQDQILQ